MIYDITIITENDKGIAAAHKHIEDVKGSIKKQVDLGTKTFTYPIKKRLEGIYTVFMVETEPDNINALNRSLSMDNVILRHLIITSDESFSTLQNEKINEMTQHEEHERPAAKPIVTPEVQLPAEPTATKEKPVVAKKSSQQTTETEKETKERQKVLDQKLAEILEEK